MPVSKTPIGDQLADPVRVRPTVDGGEVVAAIDLIDPKAAVDVEDRTARRQAVMEVKARALAGALPDGFTVIVNRKRYTVANVHYDGTRNAVVCEVSGLPAGANPLVFVNPPVCVPDGTFTVLDGQRVENLREDPAEAFRTIVAQTVEHAVGVG